MPSVSLSAVSKTFTGRKGEQTPVLRGIDVDVPDGEFLAILGSSGCGKSTLLRLVSGLEKVTSGTITIDGDDVTGTSPEKRELAMVFQNYALFPHLNVRENILFGLKSRGEDKQVRSERLAEAAELLGLAKLLNRKPAELSGGQRQRVALGRALVSGKRLILMDEPLSNLDAKLRADMRTELKRIQRQLDLTIIYVTHDQVEAMTMADRVMMLSDGHIEQVATPEEIYRAPATTTVGRFIGSPPMNIIDISTADDLSTLLPADLRKSGGGLGVRPEFLHVHADGQSHDSGRIDLGTATVLANELLGADRIVTSTRADGQRVVARVDPTQAVPAETAITLSAPPSALHWYHPESNRRISR